MRTHFSTCLFFFLTLTIGPLVFAEDMAKKQGICLSCHSVNAQTAFPGPQLGGLSTSYINEQLLNFKTGLRNGGAAAEVMQAAVQNLSEQQLLALSGWASDLEKEQLFDDSKAKSSAGYQVYEAMCLGCHSSFMGRLMTSSPRLDGLSPEYIVRQITLFKAGKRTVATPSKHQTKMMFVIDTLSDEELSSLNHFIEQSGPAL